MAVNKHTVRIILECCPPSLVRQASGQFALSVEGVNRQFETMRQRATELGTRLDFGDINTFFGELEPRAFLHSDVWDSMPLADVLPGEMIRLGWQGLYTDLMKIDAETMLVVDSNHPDSRPAEGNTKATGTASPLYVVGSLITISPNDVLRRHSTVRLGNDELRLDLLEFVEPSTMGHRLLDSVWLPSLPVNTVAESVMPLYDDVRESIADGSITDRFRELLQHGADLGQSSFTIYNIMRAVTAAASVSQQ